jgi:hypothetical protein
MNRGGFFGVGGFDVNSAIAEIKSDLDIECLGIVEYRIVDRVHLNCSP